MPTPSTAVTVTCPSCGQGVTVETSTTCPRCGASLFSQVLDAHTARLREVTATLNQRPRSGGSTINGWGTTLLDYQPAGDRTWHATKWFTVAGLPLVPLQGLRVRPVRREGHSANLRLLYDVLEQGKPVPGRVLRTYAWALSAVVPLLVFFFWGSLVKSLFGTGPLAFFVGVALFAWAIVVLVRIHNSDKAFKAATQA
jgi:hypothetical protein